MIHAQSNMSLVMKGGEGRDTTLEMRLVNPNARLAFAAEGLPEMILDEVKIEEVSFTSFSETEESLTVRTVIREGASAFDIRGDSEGLLTIFGIRTQWSDRFIYHWDAHHSEARLCRTEEVWKACQSLKN